MLSLFLWPPRVRSQMASERLLLGSALLCRRAVRRHRPTRQRGHARHSGANKQPVPNKPNPLVTHVCPVLSER
jgi:hypothetical protein